MHLRASVLLNTHRHWARAMWFVLVMRFVFRFLLCCLFRKGSQPKQSSSSTRAKKRHVACLIEQYVCILVRLSSCSSCWPRPGQHSVCICVCVCVFFSFSLSLALSTVSTTAGPPFVDVVVVTLALRTASSLWSRLRALVLTLAVQLRSVGRRKKKKMMMNAGEEESRKRKKEMATTIS